MPAARRASCPPVRWSRPSPTPQIEASAPIVKSGRRGHLNRAGSAARRPPGRPRASRAGSGRSLRLLSPVHGHHGAESAGPRIAGAVGRVGQLACCEHYQPLARYALIADGEQIHASMFPGAFGGPLFAEKMEVAIRQRALESAAFVVNATAWLDADQQARLRIWVCAPPESLATTVTSARSKASRNSAIIAATGGRQVGVSRSRGSMSLRGERHRGAPDAAQVVQCRLPARVDS
ncbi:nitrilase-related carbon-nitrogen hydrolase [Actinacidiphila glaucinigra]|uniref:nitrilase-related carbon-nitrogen hydrolase n=1 Tax=Actinacidiphila glaucinigra TaxID=235986 RepID=UPI002DDB43DA|nr:nitrilase-related carbon-nitrogen hydrolase [Actinacidiphila glaucinigra]WSD64773.1 hypothetical protein OIE69_40710 [Actinacidiphila glaucinigra]